MVSWKTLKSNDHIYKGKVCIVFGKVKVLKTFSDCSPWNVSWKAPNFSATRPTQVNLTHSSDYLYQAI